MKPSELLADPKAWAKGARGYLASSGPCCTLGAVARCFGHGSEDFKRARDSLKNHLGVRLVAEWNDAPERTHAEVLEALKACGL